MTLPLCAGQHHRIMLECLMFFLEALDTLTPDDGACIMITACKSAV